MLRFDNALYSGKIIKESFLKRGIFTNKTELRRECKCGQRFGESVVYGLGWFVPKILHLAKLSGIPVDNPVVFAYL